MSDEQPQFPNYTPPAGVPQATRDQAKPLQKIISKMFKAPKAKMRPRGKGLNSNQNVRINHHKVKFY